MSNKLSTNLTHLGERLDPGFRGIPKVPPIVMSGAYIWEEPEEMEATRRHELPGYTYGRKGNATNDCAREILAEIDGGETSQVYASGMAAISLTLVSLLRSGDHVICNKIVFGATYSLLFNKLKQKYNVEVDFVDFTKEDVEQYFKPNTKVVYFETIGNPTMDVIDIEKMSALAHAHGAIVVIDNTFATPVVCRPLMHGADVVVYSATKFMNGHSDILAGIVVTSKEIMKGIESEASVFGPVTSPFDAFLLTRSLRTLELRMERHCSNAKKLAEYFFNYPADLSVRYPGLRGTRSYEVATREFENGLYGGMLSIDVGTFEDLTRLTHNLSLVKLVPSLGCYTTTFSDTRSSHSAMSAEERASFGISDGLVRISCGIDDIDDIIGDFDQALKKTL